MTLTRISRQAAGWTLLLLFGLGTWMSLTILTGADSVAVGWGNLVRFIERVGSLDFPPLGEILSLSAMTMAIVILGTLLAAVLSIPVAWASASNTTPGPVWRIVGRLTGVIARAVPDVVLAMVFALMLPFGAMPGILAFGLHSVGMISRLFADAIEQSDPGPRLAIRAAGGSRLQEFTAGVLPQVFPSWVATTIHRADINLRGSVILGYAGVAGLGLAMRGAFATLDYARGLAIAVIMLMLCIVMEVISSAARRRLLGVGRSRGGGRRLGPGVVIGLVVALVAGSAWVCRLSLRDLGALWSRGPTVARSFWPPNAGSYGMGRFLAAMGTTLGIALAAVAVCLVGSLVLGSFAARNVAPRPWIRTGCRGVLVVVRALPELVVAIVLIVVTGLGAPAGTLALGVCGIGLLGKLLADSLEENPPGPEQALRATGASRAQVYAGATLPLARRAVIGHVFYLLDTNIRAATILGVVGGGGIGYHLLTASQGGRYGQVTLIVGMIIVAVLAVEGLAIWTRSALR
ncbi:MAG: ABC transporter permease subunit [Micrococcales bacterium]|nr:ABC transporter permease subunit [Micrococcales bacterium]